MRNFSLRLTAQALAIAITVLVHSFSHVRNLDSRTQVPSFLVKFPDELLVLLEQNDTGYMEDSKQSTHLADKVCTPILASSHA